MQVRSIGFLKAIAASSSGSVRLYRPLHGLDVRHVPPLIQSRSPLWGWFYSTLVLAAASALALSSSFLPGNAETAASGFVHTANEHGNTISRINLYDGTVDIVAIGIKLHNVQFVPAGNLLLAAGTVVGRRTKPPTAMAGF